MSSADFWKCRDSFLHHECCQTANFKSTGPPNLCVAGSGPKLCISSWYQCQTFSVFWFYHWSVLLFRSNAGNKLFEIVLEIMAHSVHNSAKFQLKLNFYYADFHRNFPAGKVVDANHESRRYDFCSELLWFVSDRGWGLCRKVGIMEFGPTKNSTKGSDAVSLMYSKSTTANKQRFCLVLCWHVCGGTTTCRVLYAPTALM